MIVGQEDVIEQLLISLLARGHCLLVGVPGLAKTLLIRTLARVLDLKFNRIQFTPDLMPSDITGTEILEGTVTRKTKAFKFIQGPVFANIVLADEINRTPPKTQAALLEAMQEHHVTAGGETHILGEPFFVLATQNPIEQEGTYPLPEAQLDRFMFNLWLDYPTVSQEIQIVKATTSQVSPTLKHVLTGEEIIGYQDLVRKVPVAENVVCFCGKACNDDPPEKRGVSAVHPGLAHMGSRTPRITIPHPWRQDQSYPERTAYSGYRRRAASCPPRSPASYRAELQRRGRRRVGGDHCGEAGTNGSTNVRNQPDQRPVERVWYSSAWHPH